MPPVHSLYLGLVGRDILTKENPSRGTTLSLLDLPLLAMQFTDEVAWGPGDFAIAGALLVGTGFMVVMSRKVSNKLHRAVVGVALAVALLLVWAELAVGIIGA